MSQNATKTRKSLLPIALLAIACLCLVAFILWQTGSGQPDAEPQPAPAEQQDAEQPSEEGTDETPLPSRAPTGIAMSAKQGEGELKIERSEPGGTKPAKLDEGTWTVFVYLCGSDLESMSAAASKDLNEMLSVNTGSNVRFVVQTGGARTWRNNTISSRQTGRYLIQNGKIQEVAKGSALNMGDAATLADFLGWGIKNYPAEHMGLILWDHGGGSITGVCFDELTDRDSLYLRELDTALNQAYGIMWDKFDFIGFDACLMSTLETANVLATYSDYMVASQESEPGDGWEYGTIARYLTQNPTSDGRELGKVICDSYLAAQRQNTRGFVTLSVIDLSKIDKLLNDYYRFSSEMYESGNDRQTLTAISRGMQKIENYGCNNRREGFTNMVDLGGLVALCAPVAPAAADVQAALYDAVVYQIKGTYHADACGLSTYYPLYINGKEELATFQTVAVNPAYLSYVERLAYGSSTGSPQSHSTGNVWQDSLWNWLLGNSQEATEQVQDNWNYVDDHDGTTGKISFSEQPQVDGEGTFWFRFDANGLDNAAVVSAFVYQLTEDGKHALALGETFDVYGDWETGQFSDGFDGWWISLSDGQNLNLTVQSADETSIVFTSPIELNGEECFLRIRQDIASGVSTIEGVWGALGENGELDRSVRELAKGDTIVPLYRAVTTAESAPVDDYEGEAYVLGSDKLDIVYSTLPVGEYLYSFYIRDIYGDVYCTQSVNFEIDEAGDIYF